jgi:hypothetical protein
VQLPFGAATDMFVIGDFFKHISNLKLIIH